MKSEEKQIEEMALNIQSYSDIEQSYYDGEWHSVDVYNGLARTLYSKDFRIVNKDSAVIPREEYERLKRVENEKDRLYEIKLDLENQLIEKGWTDYEGADEIEKRVSNETAKKILKAIITKLIDNIAIEGDWQLEDFEYSGEEIKEVLDELAKQFGIEIKE